MRLPREWFALLGFALAAACSSSTATVVTAPRIASGDTLAPGLTIGRYRLTRIGPVEGLPIDTLFRFTDGSPSLTSAIRYPIPDDVRLGSSREQWTRREGAKLVAIQEYFVSQKRISSFRIVFDSTQLVSIDDATIFEHFIALEVSRPDGTRIDVQTIYQVCNRFLKVRGTFTVESWSQSAFADFSREVLRLTRIAEARTRSNDPWCREPR